MTDLTIIAHRGASGTCPENTLLAFGKALEAGAKWLELDTQLAEQTLVVFHDDELERTTDGRGLLADIKLSDLRRLNAGGGEKVPLLEEVLLMAVGKAQVNIELKGPATAAATAALLTRLFAEKKLCAEDVLASSLRLEELYIFKERMPQVRRAPIYEEIPSDFVEQLRSFDPWSVHLHKALITEKIIDQARQVNCRVFAWTVNDRETAEQLARIGADGIFTDYPEKFIRKN